MFGKKEKKGEKLTDASEAVKAIIPVFLGGQQIGEVIHVKGKEIAGLEHMEIWIQLTFGAGIDKHVRDVLIAQGLYIGKPV